MSDTVKDIEEAFTRLRTGNGYCYGQATGGGDCAHNKPDDIKTVEAALSILKKMASGDDWFPIESAPKDRRIFFTRLDEGYIYVGRWHKNAMTKKGKYVGWVCDDLRAMGEIGYTPTHWKHLDQAKHIEMLIKEEIVDA